MPEKLFAHVFERSGCTWLEVGFMDITEMTVEEAFEFYNNQNNMGRVVIAKRRDDD